MEKGDPSVHHHLSRHPTDHSKPEEERLPGPKPTGAAAERPRGAAWEWPWRSIPPTAAIAPTCRPAEDAAEAAEQDESEEPTLLPAA
jgi:hypothetical protein